MMSVSVAVYTQSSALYIAGLSDVIHHCSNRRSLSDKRHVCYWQTPDLNSDQLGLKVFMPWDNPKSFDAFVSWDVTVNVKYVDVYFLKSPACLFQFPDSTIWDKTKLFVHYEPELLKDSLHPSLQAIVQSNMMENVLLQILEFFDLVKI